MKKKNEEEWKKWAMRIMKDKERRRKLREIMRTLRGREEENEGEVLWREENEKNRREKKKRE